MHARNELLYDKKTLAEVSKAIDAVTAQDVKRVVQTLLKPDALHLALIGPMKIRRSLRNFLRSSIGNSLLTAFNWSRCRPILPWY